MTGLGPGYLNAGLMKPRKGFTPVRARKNCGGKSSFLLTDLAQFDTLIETLASKPNS